MSNSAFQLGITQQQEMQMLLQDGWKLTPATTAHKITKGAWIPAKHLLYISTIVATEVAKGGARIILTVPPRHGKSEFISVNTPIWYLEKYSNKYVMNISYGLDLVTDFSLKVRTAFLDEDNHHLLSTRLRHDKLKIDRFLTTANGGVTAAGIGGPITGRGADLLIVDDYIKNAEAALSAPQKQSAWEWFKSTAWTRLEPNASVIVLATRWAQDDLIGRILEEWSEMNWIIINLPAIARENDPLGRKVGEPLWPERYNLKALMEIKMALGSYWWSAMYQQDPMASMSDAALGECIKIIDSSELPHPSKLKKVRAWDLASTEGGGDYTTGPLLAREINTTNFFILDMQRFRKSSAKVETAVETVAERDGFGIPVWMEQEPGSAGKTVIDHYAADIFSEYSFKAEKPSGQIEVRSQPLNACIEFGGMSMVRAPWNKELRKEFNAFPDCAHDDQICELALAYSKLKKNSKGATWGRGKKDPSEILRIKKPHIITNPGDLGRKLTGVTWGRRQ